MVYTAAALLGLLASIETCALLCTPAFSNVRLPVPGFPISPGAGRASHAASSMPLSRGRRAALCGAVLSATAGAGEEDPRRLASEAEQKQLDDLRRLAARAQQQPSAAAVAAIEEVRSLRKELAVKAAARETIVERARQLLAVAGRDERLSAAASDLDMEAVLAKNPQLALLDRELARLAEAIRERAHPGLCALEPPSKRYGYVRQMNAQSLVLAMNSDSSGGVAEVLRAADAEQRFLTDADLQAIQAALSANTRAAEGAVLRRAAAVMLRDFQRTIVEGAEESVKEELLKAVEPGRERGLTAEEVATAYLQELLHLLRLVHYATASGVASFTDSEQVRLLREALMRHKIDGTILRMSLVGMQKRANFLCKCSQAEPKCWVASHYAFIHLIEALVWDETV